MADLRFGGHHILQLHDIGMLQPAHDPDLVLDLARHVRPLDLRLVQHLCSPTAVLCCAPYTTLRCSRSLCAACKVLPNSSCAVKTASCTAFARNRLRIACRQSGSIACVAIRRGEHLQHTP